MAAASLLRLAGRGAQSALSIAAITSGASGLVRLPKAATTRPLRSITYLWKYHSGAAD